MITNTLIRRIRGAKRSVRILTKEDKHLSQQSGGGSSATKDDQRGERSKDYLSEALSLLGKLSPCPSQVHLQNTERSSYLQGALGGKWMFMVEMNLICISQRDRTKRERKEGWFSRKGKWEREGWRDIRKLRLLTEILDVIWWVLF